MLKEKILCAAIDYNGTIICGHRHGDCYDILSKLAPHIKNDQLPGRQNQGFLTSDNRYVDRKEAWIIAKKNNQIAYGLESSDEILISENLY